MNNADPKQIVLTYNPSTETITETITDTTNNATATVTIPNVNLAAILGGNLAYVGFTGASGGLTATQTISNFNIQTTSGGALSSSDDVTVEAGAALETGSSALTINSLSGAGTVTTVASGPATLYVGSGTFSGTIANGSSSELAVVQEGTGTLTLSGADTYTGGTTVSGGTLILDGTSFASSSVTIASGATLQVGNDDTAGTLGSAAVDNEGSLIFSPSGTLTVNGNISGSGSLSQDGSGIITLSGMSTYTGPTEVNDGTLALASNAAAGETTGISVDGETLDVQANLAASIPIDVFDSGALETSTGEGTIGGSVTLEGYGVRLGGAGMLQLAGTITDNGTVSGYGLTAVGPGTVILGADEQRNFCSGR